MFFRQLAAAAAKKWHSKSVTSVQEGGKKKEKRKKLIIKSHSLFIFFLTVYSLEKLRIYYLEILPSFEVSFLFFLVLFHSLFIVDMGGKGLRGYLTVFC